MKILFATMPFDGHFDPLTGIAVHLRRQGHDVRWYAGPSYQQRLRDLGLPGFPFRRAREVNGQNIHDLFPERAPQGTGTARVRRRKDLRRRSA